MVASGRHNFLDVVDLFHMAEGDFGDISTLTKCSSMHFDFVFSQFIRVNIMSSWHVISNTVVTCKDTFINILNILVV